MSDGDMGYSRKLSSVRGIGSVLKEVSILNKMFKEVLLKRWHLSKNVQLFATPWTVAHQAPLSLVFSRQEYWSG